MVRTYGKVYWKNDAGYVYDIIHINKSPDRKYEPVNKGDICNDIFNEIVSKYNPEYPCQ